MGSFTDNGVTVFIDEVEVDRAIFMEMEPEYASPVGVLTYVQGVRYALQTDGNQTGHNGPWPAGDLYIARLAQYLDEVERRKPISVDQDYSDNVAAIGAFEATLPSVDPSEVVKKQYLGLNVQAYITKTSNKIIGVVIADMHGQGALAMLDVLVEDCNNYDIPLFGVLSPYNGTSPTALLASLVAKGFTSSGEIGQNMTYVYKLADDTPELRKSRAFARISAERARRIALGTMATVTGVGPFLVDTRDEVDFRNINGLTAKGIVLLMSGDTTTTVTFRDADNIDRVMNSQQLIEFGASIGNAVDALYKKSWALKAMDPLPDDITDAQYW